MELIASYPIDPNVCTSYVGKAIYGVTRHGDRFCGVLEEIKDGHLYISPIEGDAGLQISGAKKEKRNKKRIAQSPKVNVRAFGFGYAPYGYNFAAGLAFAIPLLLIASLFTFPFWY